MITLWASLFVDPLTPCRRGDGFYGSTGWNWPRSWSLCGDHWYLYDPSPMQVPATVCEIEKSPRRLILQGKIACCTSEGSCCIIDLLIGRYLGANHRPCSIDTGKIPRCRSSMHKSLVPDPFRALNNSDLSFSYSHRRTGRPWEHPCKGFVDKIWNLDLSLMFHIWLKVFSSIVIQARELSSINGIPWAAALANDATFEWGTRDSR